MAALKTTEKKILKKKIHFPIFAANAIFDNTIAKNRYTHTQNRK